MSCLAPQSNFDCTSTLSSFASQDHHSKAAGRLVSLRRREARSALSEEFKTRVAVRCHDVCQHSPDLLHRHPALQIRVCNNSTRQERRQTDIHTSGTATDANLTPRVSIAQATLSGNIRQHPTEAACELACLNASTRLNKRSHRPPAHRTGRAARGPAPYLAPILLQILRGPCLKRPGISAFRR